MILLKRRRILNQKIRKKIVVGFFITNISKIDLGKKFVNVDFSLWWRSPYGDYDYVKNMEVVNASDVKMAWIISHKIENDYATIARFSCDVRNNWEVTNFPFDRQKIVLSI